MLFHQPVWNGPIEHMNGARVPDLETAPPRSPARESDRQIWYTLFLTNIAMV